MAVSDPRPKALPEGFVYRADFLTAAEEDDVLSELVRLRFDPIVMRGQTARRTARRFGMEYDYDTRTPRPGDPLPTWLDRVRERAGQLAGIDVAELPAALVQRYPPGSTIGWHRDAPAFDVVVGLSLGGPCRMRFRRPKEPRDVREMTLEPRSGYVLQGAARWGWQHSIPSTKEERYSITFRSLRNERSPMGGPGRAAKARSH